MNSNNNTFYINRIIKLISPLTCQTFKIELNGEENELRELLGTILEINPKSIKGLRDSYNNYYTLSSAVKNPHINTDPFNYYTVVIKGIAPSNNLKFMKYPSLNLYKKERISSISNDSNNKYQNNLNKSLSYFGNDDEDDNTSNIGYLYHNSNKSLKNGDHFNKKDFLKFAEDLYKRKYIDHSLERKLKKLIKENNKEVLSILNPYLNLQSYKNYDELAKKIKPVISSRSLRKENIEESKQKSSSSPSESSNSNDNSSKKEKKSKKDNKNNKNKKNKKNSNNNNNNGNNNNNNNNNNSKKKVKMSDEEKILEDIKLNFTKDKYEKLKGLLENKNQEIIKIIKNFEKDNDYNHLLSKLSRLVENLSENSNDEEREEENISVEENDSSYYIREDTNCEKNNNKKNKKSKSKSDSPEVQKISKNICNALKNKGKDLFYIAKYDLQKLKNDDKISLFTKQFKLNIEKLSNDNFKIPKKNITIIKNYYNQYIIKKICKNFTDDEKVLYERLLEEDEENNMLFPLYKELLNHKDLNELKNQIKKVIKETAERIEEEENEDEDGKNLIKEENEENEENEDEEDEEEEDEGEGEEEEDGEGEEDEDNQDEKESDNNSNKNSSSNKDTFILKDGNKDRAANILNNNYRKINNFSNFANNNNNANNDNKNNDDENKDNNDNDNDNNNNNDNNNQNLGLGFVVVKQKKPIKEEEKKDPVNNVQNNDNKFNTTISQAKESSQSTNNPNKKLNQFIAQIEHLKKIDDIKKTIIEAIHANNKYVMDLFQKFQKNKLNLNPKSLNAVYKQIIENPDTTSKDYIFKSLIKEVPDLNEFLQDFLVEQFIIHKNSELETYYSLYEESKNKNEFIESIGMFMKKPTTQKALVQYSLKKIKSEMPPNFFKKNENGNENDNNINNEELVSKSKEIIKLLQKYNLFSEKEYNIIMNSLENNDTVFTATFQVLFDDKDLNEFYETMYLALDNQIKIRENKEESNEGKWNNDIIKKNYKELKKRLEEKQLNTLEELYKTKNEILYNILKDLNSSNINEKIENAKTLILKRELSAT